MHGKSMAFGTDALAAMRGDAGSDMGDDAGDGGLPPWSALCWTALSRKSVSSHLGSCNGRVSSDCAYVGVKRAAPRHTGDG